MDVATEMLKRLLQRKMYTLSEVSSHSQLNDCWIVVGDHVYDVTRFIDEHPGGKDLMLENAGRDATIAFYGAGHYPETHRLLDSFCIGTLAQKERIETRWSTQDGVKVVD